MCTVISLHRPGHAWPVLLAANRDESLIRPWDAPAEHWPGIIGGRDATAGGSWMAMNRRGLVAAVLNRVGSLGPAAGKRSRGELPLLALAEPSLAAAVHAITALDAGQWRPFNLVLADAGGAVFLAGFGHGHPISQPLAPGISMVTAHPPNDLTSARTARHLPRWRDAAPPESPADWGNWPSLLADSGGSRDQALSVPPLDGFGTVSASLVALGANLVWHFAAGAPGQVPFRPVQGFAG